MDKKSLFLAVVVALFGVFYPSVHAEIRVVRFATESYPPFTTINSNQELQGFDVDIAKAICEKMQAQCIFSNDKFSNMVRSLQNNQYDAWINAITIHKELQPQVSFSDPYFSTKAQFLAINYLPSHHPLFNATPVEIVGKTIGVGEVTCYPSHLRAAYGDTLKIERFPTKEASYAALEQGRVDAIIGDAEALRDWRLSQKNLKRYRLIDLPAKYPDLAWHKYGIAVAKGNAALLKEINSAIALIKSDGTYGRIKQKYFGR